MTQTLEDRVGNLETTVRDLDYYYRRLDERQTDLEQSVEKLHTKFDELKEDALRIVREASTNTPRWLMGFIVSILLVMVLANAGWIIEQIILHH